MDRASTLTAAGTVLSVGGDTTVMGFAGLTLRSENGSCIEVRDGYTLTLHGVDLKAEAHEYAISGSNTEEQLVIASSVLDLHSEQGAVRGFNGGIDLHVTCYYKEPDSAQIRDGAIKEKYNVLDPLHIPEILNELLIYTYADLDADGAVTIDDLLEFIVFVANDKAIMAVIFLTLMGHPAVLEKYDFDLNGQNGRQDFQFFINRLFPDGTVYRVVLGAYDAESGQLLQFLAFQNIAEISLDELSNFVMEKNVFRMFIIDKNAVPLCKATSVDRSQAE